MTGALIEIEGLRFGYHGRPPILSGVDLVLRPGDRLGLVGANGTGKTTLLHLIVGLLRPRSGRITAFGKIREMEEEYWEVRARAGLLFQDPDDQLFCPTVIEDVAFGPLNLGRSRQEAMEIARETLARLGMAGFEDRITYQLSGGEKRMVTLAAVLAMEPEVLLLDEPSNALDTAATERLVHTLLGLPQAMIIVSHDGAFLDRLTTRRVRLEDGKAVAVL